jgi:hypothetical protein
MKTVINPNTVLLNGVSVVRDVVTSKPGCGFNTGSLRTVPFSMRHPSRCQQGGQESLQRRGGADYLGADHAADWAGRPGRSLGFLASQSPACIAGRRISMRWPLAGLKPAGGTASALTRGKRDW